MTSKFIYKVIRIKAVLCTDNNHLQLQQRAQSVPNHSYLTDRPSISVSSYPGSHCTPRQVPPLMLPLLCSLSKYRA